jgi:hypothetical protein
MSQPIYRAPSAGGVSLAHSTALTTAAIAGAWELIDVFLPGSTPAPWGTTLLRALVVAVITYVLVVAFSGSGS